MTAFIEVVSVSLACLIFVGVVGWVADTVERRAHRRRGFYHSWDGWQWKDPEGKGEWWRGDPPDGDTFP